MSAVEYGFVSWDEVSVNRDFDENAPRGKDLWLKLKHGDNIVRVLTQAAPYKTHTGVKKDGDPGYGRKIPCIGKDCPVCVIKNSDKKPKFPKQDRFYIGVIDRVTQSFKILDTTHSVVKGIVACTKDDDFGNPKRYDINIIVDKQAKGKGYYDVKPKLPKPLSEADIEIQNSLDINKLILDKIAPRSVEWVTEQLTQALGSSSQSSQSVSNDDDSDSSKDEFVFEDA